MKKQEHSLAKNRFSLSLTIPSLSRGIKPLAPALRGEGFGVRGFIQPGHVGNHESKKTLI
jgi:hypothetical protein